MSAAPICAKPARCSRAIRPVDFNYLVGCYLCGLVPEEPRFEVIYHLLSIAKKERVRLKVRLSAATAPWSSP